MPNSKGMYKIEEIKEGLDKFYAENGHYPSTIELNDCLYLPSARQIQRRFGGLPELKSKLGIKDTHLGKGEFRKNISLSVNKKGFAAERDLEKILIEHFGEPFVHMEKPINNHEKTRFDFFIYSKNVNFGVDIFYSETRRNIQININSKLDNYKDVQAPLYFVLANNDIDQKILDEISAAKPHKPFPRNIKLIALSDFIKFIKKLTPLSAI